MSRLLPVPVAQLATKDDLRSEIDHLGDKLRAEFATQLSQQITRQTWTLVVAMIMIVAAVAGLT